jgi:hypothetical protein
MNIVGILCDALSNDTNLYGFLGYHIGVRKPIDINPAAFLVQKWEAQVNLVRINSIKIREWGTK